MPPLLVRSRVAEGLRAVYGTSDFGYPQLAHSALPDRVYVGLDEAQRPPSVVHAEPEDDVAPLPAPLDVLLGAGEARPWPKETERALARLEAAWLLTEDRYRLLDAEAIEPLAHQATLVEHVITSPHLKRVLIADEVGLGKTLEAALLIRRLIAAHPAGLPRVLYLAPAALVSNVVDELRRAGLSPREWSTSVQEARLTPNESDPLVVASLHRAVFSAQGGVNHFATVAASGPWDVVIVDEAHHLTDWSEDGTDPQQRMRLVRMLVRERLTNDGRVILLTGTPHQGHGDRFRNLLRLLDPDENHQSARGRVIYRTKDDILDWDGNPLFPVRRVLPPDAVDGGPEWTEWLEQIHRLLTPSAGDRAGAWRRAQALQWCASSPKAGLAFLVRMAIRAGHTVGTLPGLRESALALRPYRGGPADERAEALLVRMGAAEASDDEGEVGAFLDSEELGAVLAVGTRLIASDAVGRKLAPLLRWLGEIGDEKIVVFAQPIETVDMLVERLEGALGDGTVVRIVGGQPRGTRADVVRAFREDPRVRVLVSSRAGGEGINLQVARHLVHFDVPWNPMELEQRVGRVHRYGSARTVVVRTIVLAGSREERVLARARARLGEIVRDLDADQFERLFSRTMSLIPLDQLADLMAAEGFGSLAPPESDRLDELVSQGFKSWKAADGELRSHAERLRQVERGQADDRDLQAFLQARLGLPALPGWVRLALTNDKSSAENEIVRTPVSVFSVGEAVGYVGRDGGLGLERPDGRRQAAVRLGLNHPQVASRVRAFFRGADASTGGEAWVRGGGVARLSAPIWAEWARNAEVVGYDKGGVLLAWLVRHLDLKTVTPREVQASLHLALVRSDANGAVSLRAPAAAALIRVLRDARFPHRSPSLDADTLMRVEAEHRRILRSSARGEAVRAVFPVAAVSIDLES